MSLALVQISTTDFQSVHGHLTTFTPHQNMHVRDFRLQSGCRVLRSLHGMFATTSTEIEGMISGPSVFWHYRLRLVRGRTTQLDVLDQQCSAADATRVQRRFLQDILARVQEERARLPGPQFSNLSTGQLYLRRYSGGMLSSHPNCQNAVSNGVLDPQFVAQLQPWNLRLVMG